MTGELLIDVRSVGKTFGAVKALDAVSFSLEPGRRTAVLGHSASGKTTFLRLLAGLELPDEGEIELSGRVASRAGWALSPGRRGLGYVFQSPALWPHMTVAAHLRFGLHGVPRAEAERRVTELAELTGLQGLEKRYPDQLSGGQARRVALARTLAPRPRCLLMDEPLTSLDDELREQMLGLIDRAAAETGAALVYVTHDRSEAVALGAAIWRMDAGRLTPPQPEASGGGADA
jgi:iron(III) transport system ATP-binding protein